MKDYPIKCLIALLIAMLLAGCGELERVQKSKDLNLKYDYAKKYYNQQKWRDASSLLIDVVPAYNGTEAGAQALFMLATSERMQKNYETALECYRSYYNSYPKGPFVEEARFMAGKVLSEVSPDPRLDQSTTYAAQRELQTYLDFHPKGAFSEEAKELLFALQDKLALKELMAAQLYYDLGMHMGNNYRAAFITANNALKSFPHSIYREDYYMLMLRAIYQEALHSVDSKRQERFRSAVDRYFVYTNEFPQGKYRAEADRIYKNVQQRITPDN